MKSMRAVKFRGILDMSEQSPKDCERDEQEADGEILIMGTPVAPGNRGVMALGASLVDLCSQAMPRYRAIFLQRHRPWPDVEVLTKSGPVSVKVLTCQLHPNGSWKENFAWIVLMSFMYSACPPLRRRIRRAVPWIDAVANAFLVGDIRGGDSFSDIYGFRRFFEASLLTYSCSLIRGSIAHFPQTYGPFKSPLAEWIAKRVLRRSSMIYARDAESQAIAQSLVGRKLRVGLSPDVAFALATAHLAEIRVAPPMEHDEGSEMVGINVNGLVFNGGYGRDNQFGLVLDYRQFLIDFVTEMVTSHRVRIILVPHTFARHGDVESDNEACAILRSLLPKSVQESVHVVEGEYDQHEIKAVIGRCDFFMGCRMHACIAALSQGIPCIGIAYSKKFKGVFESVDAGEFVIDARTVGLDAAMKRAVELFERRKQITPRLVQAVQVAKARLLEVFGEIAASLGVHDEPESPPLSTGWITLRSKPDRIRCAHEPANPK
jgi:colanic acid/amylovoran biosynthesis protein